MGAKFHTFEIYQAREEKCKQRRRHLINSCILTGNKEQHKARPGGEIIEYFNLFRLF